MEFATREDDTGCAFCACDCAEVASRIRAYQSNDLHESPEDETDGEKDSHDDRLVCDASGWLGGWQAAQNSLQLRFTSSWVLRFPERGCAEDAARKRDRVTRCRMTSRSDILGGWMVVRLAGASGQEQDKKWCLNTRRRGALHGIEV